MVLYKTVITVKTIIRKLVHLVSQVRQEVVINHQHMPNHRTSQP